jgi:PAS domain-containing protein
VCERCHLGLILTGRSDAVPAEQDAFIVVDALMRVRAVSKRAEELLRISETDAVNQLVWDFLVPAEDGAQTTSKLAGEIVTASRLDVGPRRTVLRPRDVFGVRYGVRIAGCSPGPAAILVLGEQL